MITEIDNLKRLLLEHLEAEDTMKIAEWEDLAHRTRLALRGKFNKYEKSAQEKLELIKHKLDTSIIDSVTLEAIKRIVR